MKLDARSLLVKLLADGERTLAGTRSMAPRLTKRHLEPYWHSKSLAAREVFDDQMKAASDAGAVSLIRDHGLSTGEIRAIDLVDLDRLATFLGVKTRSGELVVAGGELASWLAMFPVLEDVLEHWRLLRKVRGTTPDAAANWSAAAKVVSAMQTDAAVRVADLPVREVSARLFRDSKKIEGITGLIDVLLTGDVLSPPRDPREVWSEIGLRREEQPARLAGHVEVVRERVTALLDIPYGAFPPATVLGVTDSVASIMTIENLTTFHSEAVARCDEPVLLIYTAGMPSPAWRTMYERIITGVPANTPLMHWGDVDEGGFRIAAQIATIAAATGRRLEPYNMEPEDVPESVRRPASKTTCEHMRHFARSAGWPELGERVARARVTVEQEAI